MRWTKKQKMIAVEAAELAAMMDASMPPLTAAEMRLIHERVRERYPLQVACEHYYCYGWRVRHRPLESAPAHYACRHVDLPLRYAAEIRRQALIIHERYLLRHSADYYPSLARRLATFKARRAGGRKAALTRWLRRQSAAVQQACLTWASETCEVCDGHGLRYSGKWERDIRCYSCGGAGEHQHREVSYEAIAAARAAGPDEGAMIAAAGDCTSARWDWDGTLTSTWERQGEIDSEQAAAIRESCARRHEATDYDDLLAAGVSKDDARSCCS